MHLQTSASWLAAAPSALHEIFAQGRPLMVGYLRQIFASPAFTLATQQPGTAGQAARTGLEFGLGKGLALSASGQAFVWPYLLGGPPLVSGTAPGVWVVCLFAAAVGLAVALRSEWAGLWSRGRGATQGAGQEWLPLLVAAVPCVLVQWRLGALATRYHTAASVGVFLLLSGAVLRLAEGWLRRNPPSAPSVPPWLALCAGALAGFGALPGLSTVAILLAAVLYGRVSVVGAGRFALMAATIVMVLEGLIHFRSALLLWPAHALPLAAAAAVGAAAGGWLLLVLLRVGQRALPVMASYCTATAALLLLFGVFAR